MPVPDIRLLSALAVSLLLSACAQPKPEIREVRIEVPVPTPEVLPADAAARQLLSHHERLMKLSPAELAHEVAPRDDGKLTPAAATQLALALTLHRSNGDLARAQALLDQVQRDTTLEAQAWLSLVRLLQGRLAEQRRLEEHIDKLNQQARDSQRDNQRRLDQLNEKLEALKAIERSLNTRPAATKP
ncbi:hypothetical protein OOZ63_28445 [Paucibacter sp. PLA-PC-4]|uniref:hypothetical protein n=1 Tax=Paucibacter sp. PLA-PC-4 TaxID=2993655 RepID=UPI00224A8400|nr:hypothetical protein [Paucibacter sp. PLA-PC-4]MCX2865757.1 hypothetical protein [Paucibacter sp. PLA-PC-4]